MGTYRQSTLIRGSLPMLRAQGETITSSFYASLLSAHPELHNIFNSANQATGRQPRALLNIILAFAAAPNHTAELIPRLERVCQKHCSLVFLSAGVGATPLMSILNSVLEAPDVQQQISWIHCSRRKPLFEDHIRTVGRRHKNFHSRFWRSVLADREQRVARSPGWDNVCESMRLELEGVDRSVLGLDHGAAEYFICGPDAFAASVRKFLLEQGVGESRIRVEWFSTGELEAR